MNRLIIISKCLVLSKKSVVYRKKFIISSSRTTIRDLLTLSKGRDPVTMWDDTLFGMTDCTMLVNFNKVSAYATNPAQLVEVTLR